jgi:hypothetical protein
MVPESSLPCPEEPATGPYPVNIVPPCFLNVNFNGDPHLRIVSEELSSIDYPLKILYAFLIFLHTRATRTAQLIFLYLITLLTFRYEYKLHDAPHSAIFNMQKTPQNLKVTVFWYAPCSLVEVYRRFRRSP